MDVSLGIPDRHAGDDDGYNTAFCTDRIRYLKKSKYSRKDKYIFKSFWYERPDPKK